MLIVYRERDGEIAAVERVNEAHAREDAPRSLVELEPLWEKEGLRAIALPDEVYPRVHRVERSPQGLSVVARNRRSAEGLEIAPSSRPWHMELREFLREARRREQQSAARGASETGEALWGDLKGLAIQGFRRCISDCLLRGREYRRPAVTKKVSVIIPCFNMGRFLGNAIQSALDQTVKAASGQEGGEGQGGNALEVIVVAQGCTDQSAATAKSYAEKDDRVRVVEMPVNLGASFARNWGILHACGEWYGFLDADDAYEAGAVEAMTQAGQAARGQGLPVVVHGRSRAWDAEMKRPMYEEGWRGQVTAERLREGCCFIPGCMLAHETAFWEAGLWWAEFWQRIEDYEWQAAALGRVRFAHLDRIVLRKRETAESRAKWPMQSEWSRTLRRLLQGWLRR